MIVIAADEISGPAKGVLQFLQNAPTDTFDYVVCNYDVKGRADGDFINEMRRRKLNIRLLEQRFPFDPNLVVQARHILAEYAIDVVQTHGYKSNAIGLVLKLLCRRPWIGFAHGYIDDTLRNKCYNRIDRLVLRGADRVVAVSESMRRLLADSGISNRSLRVIHNAIDPGEIVPRQTKESIAARHGLSPENIVVGVVGRLSPEKGQLVFLRAMEAVVRHVTNVRALIVGDGRDRATLEAYCRDKRLAKFVTFAGHQGCIGDYYQVLDLLVLPSLSEGLPNAVLEAMSFGVPVLATTVGGVEEVIQVDNGALVPPNDPGALAKKMVELLKDDTVRRGIGLRGKRSLYPRFAAEGRASRILDMYRELLSPGPSTKVAP